MKYNILNKLNLMLIDWQYYIIGSIIYCTRTEVPYLFNFTLFNDHGVALNLACMKYYEIFMNLLALVSLAFNEICMNISKYI